jgi:hypothetical protein
VILSQVDRAAIVTREHRHRGWRSRHRSQLPVPERCLRAATTSGPRPVARRSSAVIQTRTSSPTSPGPRGATAVAAHPGIAASTFWENAAGTRFRWAARAADAGIAVVFGTTELGARPVLPNWFAEHLPTLTDNGEKL